MLSVDGLAIFFFAVIPALSYRTDLVYPLKCPTGQDSALCNSESGFVAILESGAERLGVGVFELGAGGKAATERRYFHSVAIRSEELAHTVGRVLALAR